MKRIKEKTSIIQRVSPKIMNSNANCIYASIYQRYIPIRGSTYKCKSTKNKMHFKMIFKIIFIENIFYFFKNTDIFFKQKVCALEKNSGYICYL